MQLKNLRHLSFSIAKIDVEAVKLQRELRRYFNSFRQGKIDNTTAISQGNFAIYASFNRMLKLLQEWFARQGLPVNFENQQELYTICYDALDRWRHIINGTTVVQPKTDNAPVNPALWLMPVILYPDTPKAVTVLTPQEPTTQPLDVQNVTYNPPQVTQNYPSIQTLTQPALKSDYYWTSRTGLLRRIDGMSQDLQYHTVNKVMRIAAAQHDAYAMHWITEEDEKVCETCQKYGTGGDGGYYLMHWHMPPTPPVHPNCRCTYEMLIEK